MPVIVANDIYGGDVYSIGRERYRRPCRWEAAGTYWTAPEGPSSSAIGVKAASGRRCKDGLL